MSSKILSVEDIFLCEDIKDETVEVREWGGKVIIRALTMEERGKVRELSKVYNSTTGKLEIDVEQFDIATFIMGVREPKFDASHILKLKTEKSSGAIARVVKRIAMKSGMIDEAVEQISKNSTTDQTSE